jgi:hypothetical protein
VSRHQLLHNAKSIFWSGRDGCRNRRGPGSRNRRAKSR